MGRPSAAPLPATAPLRCLALLPRRLAARAALPTRAIAAPLRPSRRPRNRTRRNNTCLPTP
eukprot:3620888-Lingulodinium_polyedra.AAC.1